ncbi:MAG: HD domain-containing protein [Thermofilaceae archaeon]
MISRKVYELLWKFLHIRQNPAFWTVFAHSVLVEELARAYCSVFCSEEEELLAEAAAWHDVGKLLLPPYILLKPGPLTPAEKLLVRIHPVFSFFLASKLGANRSAAQAALFHHERWDGKGYPLGIGGTNIPEPARVVSVLDTVAALLEARPYKQGAFSKERASELICSLAGKQFDPSTAQAVARLINSISTPQSETQQDKFGDLLKEEAR